MNLWQLGKKSFHHKCVSKYFGHPSLKNTMSKSTQSLHTWEASLLEYETRDKFSCISFNMRPNESRVRSFDSNSWASLKMLMSFSSSWIQVFIEKSQHKIWEKSNCQHYHSPQLHIDPETQIDRTKIQCYPCIFCSSSQRSNFSS